MPRVRTAIVVAAALAVVAAALIDRGVWPHERTRPIVVTPEERASGERVFRAWCLHCHTDVPLARRVAGWSPERAYEAIGRLPEISGAMPPFRGTDAERRSLAVFVGSLGAPAPGPVR